MSPEVQRERLFAQEPKILEAVGLLSARIKAIPRDPANPDLEPRALIVGGFVRDSLLGKKPKDADVEVYGITAERLENVLGQIFPGKVDAVGRAFGVLKVFVEDGVDFDVSLPRRESKTGEGHKGFLVQGDPTMDIKEAARRRDFSVNALAADPLTGEVFDYFNGVNDLKDRVLRVTDPERFQDDPLRVYRAVQFIGRMGFSMNPESAELMREMVERGDLDELSPERITEEWKKLLLKSERPSLGFEAARELGVIKKHYPEMHALIDTPQEPEWHPEGDVWIHTMMVVDAGAKISREEERGLSEQERLQVVLGAVCHDLGKPSTTKVEGGRVRSLAHEEAGREPTRAMLERMNFGEAAVHAAETIAAEHLKPGTLNRSHKKEPGTPGSLDEKQYVNAVRKLLKRIHPVSWRVMAAASEADHRGRAIPGVDRNPYEAGLFFAEMVLKHRLDEAPVAALVRGADILDFAKELGIKIKPGPRFGELIKKVETARDAGEITTREEGLTLLKRLISEVQ